MVKTYYTIERKLPNVFIVWHNIQTETGFSFWSIYKGTYKECKEYCNDRGLKVERSKLLW